MKFKIDKNYNSDVLKLSMNQDDIFNSRAKSLSTYGGNINVDTSTTRSLWKALDSRENFPVTELSVEKGTGVATLVPPYPGEIEHVKLESDMKIQTLSYLGSSEYVNTNLNMSGIYVNDSLGTLEVVSKNNENGTNDLFISGYGGIDEIELNEQQQTNVREDYLVGFEESVSYRKIKSASIKSKALGAKDKPIIKITGPGKVYTQVRSPVKNEEIFDKLA